VLQLWIESSSVKYPVKFAGFLKGFIKGKLKDLLKDLLNFLKGNKFGINKSGTELKAFLKGIYIKRMIFRKF